MKDTGASMKTRIPVENGDTLAAIQGFLKKVLETEAVDALLVPMRTPSGTITPGLVCDPQALDQADPLAPVLPVNGATLAGRLSFKEPRPKVAVVLRACELRALVELIKMQQANLENMTLIAVDCAGTFSVPVYQKKITTGLSATQIWQEVYKNEKGQNGNGAALRQACQICENPVYGEADIVLELIGSDLEQEVRLSATDEWAARLELTPIELNSRDGLVEELRAARLEKRDAEFAALRERLEGGEGIQGVLAACIRCHNCMTVCPICYCKTCVFQSAIFDHEPQQYANWARQKGAWRMPSDTTLFHMTRLNHMALSCVGCGMCTEACPAELPVGALFRAIGQRLQATFDYVPGRSKEEALPLVTFKADEWNEVGE
jgi:formate dehydrogenase (coenzyme F420) beta subunit